MSCTPPPQATGQSPRIRDIMQSVGTRTQEFLSNEIGLVGKTALSGPADGSRELILRDLTSLVSVGGNINMIVAFSFDAGLIGHVCHKLMDGLLADGEDEAPYINDAASEVINTIIGNCTSDLADKHTIIHMSPPMVVTGARSVHRAPNVRVVSIVITMPPGCLELFFIGPSDLFAESPQPLFASSEANP